MSVFRTKSVEASMAASEEADHKLKRTLSALDLTVFGIGVIIGAGIFTLTGRAAKDYAGPSIALSFVIGAIVCGLAALCYAEFASTVPVSGSAYTFSYATLGELIAWIIGWDLLLELMLGASVVAQGWSQYFVTFLGQLGSHLARVGRAGVALRPAGLPAHRRPDAAHRVGHQGVAARQPRARRRQALHRALRHLRGHPVHQPRQLVARSSRRRSRARPRRA